MAASLTRFRASETVSSYAPPGVSGPVLTYIGAMATFELIREDDDEPEWVDEEIEAVGASAWPTPGTRIMLVGRFGGMNRRQAANLLRSFGAVVIDPASPDPDLIIIGAQESPIAEAEWVQRIAAHDSTATEVVHETEAWERLGLVDTLPTASQLYTAAMLAHLLDVSVRAIRRWHRRGLIRPVRTLGRLAYFDFQEVATARRLAQWIAQGASTEAIERRLVELIDNAPDLRRPLDQLSILVEGRQVLLRVGEGLVESGGQMRFDFEPSDWDDAGEDANPGVLVFPPPNPADEIKADPSGSDELWAAAFEAEDEEDFAGAIDCYHAILARDGHRAEVHLQIAELLQRIGEPIAARERYFAAIETDPEDVEARAGLGTVLVQTGQPELAVAAFRGAIRVNPEFAEVHYHLAVTLDSLGRADEAVPHWRVVAGSATHGRWVDQARQRLTEVGG